ncbi:MAG: secondary thiamine-phosphate synthase enzyme YjbQ [Candidatus Heimdallarchaeaceae archaeon]
MEVFTQHISFQTQGEIDIIDLSPMLEKIVAESGIKEGVLTVNVIGSTGAITTIEYEPRVLDDFRRILEQLVPKGAGYKHDQIDSNAHSHLRASIIGPSISISIIKGRLQLGTWQQVVFVDLDVRPRSRTVAITVIGKS